MNLLREHPEAFEEAKRYEKNAIDHSAPFTWSDRESLDELARPERTAQIESEFKKRQERLPRGDVPMRFVPTRRRKLPSSTTIPWDASSATSEDVMPDPDPKPPTGITINEIYKEQYAHFRALNDILYKIPPLFTAVIGALWLFAV